MTSNSKRRRLYLHDPSIPIPRTTLWYQSKYHSSLPVCQTFSDRDEQEPPSDPESPSNQDVQEPPCDQDSQDPPSEWDDQQRLSNLGDQEPPSYQDSQDPSSDRDDREPLSDQSSQDPPSDWNDQEPPSDSGDQDLPSDWDDPDPSSDQELDMNHHPTGNRSSPKPLTGPLYRTSERLCWFFCMSTFTYASPYLSECYVVNLLHHYG